MRSSRIALLVEIALSIALSAVLNTVKIFEMPQGGTISLVMLPLLVLALRRGPIAGMVAGALYGVVDVLIDPFVVHWVQFVLDYPLAYSVVGIAGLFAGVWRRSIGFDRISKAIVVALLPGVLLAALLRYAAHVMSGVVFFSEYAQGQPVLVYSALYNSYVWVSALVCFAAAVVVMPALERAVPSWK